jgi:membrane-associated phospholipid phosphatase
VPTATSDSETTDEYYESDGAGLVPTAEPITSLLRPEECLFIIFATALIVLLAITGEFHIVAHSLFTALRFVAIVAALAFVVFVRAYIRAGRRPENADSLARLRESSRVALMAVRGFGTLFFCLAIYETLHDLTPVLCKHVYDQWLIDSDHFVLHVDVGRWLNDHIGSPAMTRVLTYCYISYAFTSPIYAAYQYIRGNFRQFHDFALAITITAFIGYTGYLLLPAVGPYLFQHNVYPDALPGWGHGDMLDVIAKFKGSARDAFPSLHTAMTTVVLGCMWRDGRKVFWRYLPIALGLYLATMYLRVHYATDVAAGFVVGGVALFVAPKINKWWYARRPGALQSSSLESTQVPLQRQDDAVPA